MWRSLQERRRAKKVADEAQEAQETESRKGDVEELLESASESSSKHR